MVFVLSLLVLGACSVGPDAAEVGEVGEVGDLPAPEVASPDVPQPAPVVLGFGQAHTWPNGDTVTVAEPMPRPEPAGVGYARLVQVGVVLANGGAEVRDSSDYRVEVFAGGAAADYYVSELPDLQGQIAPGSTRRFARAYAVQSAGPVELEVQVSVNPMSSPVQPAVVFFRGTG